MSRATEGVERWIGPVLTCGLGDFFLFFFRGPARCRPALLPRADDPCCVSLGRLVFAMTAKRKPTAELDFRSAPHHPVMAGFGIAKPRLACRLA